MFLSNKLKENDKCNVNIISFKCSHTHTHTHIYMCVCVCVCVSIYKIMYIEGKTIYETSLQENRNNNKS